MKINWSIYILLILLVGCYNPKPRKPVTYSSGTDQSESIAFNKKLYNQESNMIAQYAENDTIHDYKNSSYGFWYSIINDQEDTIFPQKGDKITFNYNISDFQGNKFYSEKELGTQTYYVEQQEMIQGIQHGIQYLNTGEKAIFLLPSHMAYGYLGDNDKIGPNTPIILTIEILNITKSTP